MFASDVFLDWKINEQFSIIMSFIIGANTRLSLLISTYTHTIIAGASVNWLYCTTCPGTFRKYSQNFTFIIILNSTIWSTLLHWKTYLHRAATIQAETTGHLWAMDRQTFRRILLKSAFRKRKMYETLLDNVPMLKTLQVIFNFHKIYYVEIYSIDIGFTAGFNEFRVMRCTMKRIGLKYIHINSILPTTFIIHSNTNIYQTVKPKIKWIWKACQLKNEDPWADAVFNLAFDRTQ